MNTNVEFDGKKYRVNDIKMNVVIEGQGPDVLLVHGFPDSIAVWRHQIPALVAAGYRVIAPDQRGFGLTEAPRETKAYAIENYVVDLAALLGHAGDRKPELEQWKAELSRPGRLTAAINIYRANLKLMLPQGWSEVTVPVMGVWGEGDVALAEEQMIASAKYVIASWRYERIGDRAGHWLMLRAPEKIQRAAIGLFESRMC